MRLFIKVIDDDAWKSVLNGWTHLEIENEEKKIVPKVKSLWTPDEVKTLNMNDKALHSIYSAVDVEIFKLISTCDTAKQVWDILQTTFEGTSKVRTSRLQLLNTKFETLKMSELETIAEFNSRLKEIANDCYNLGEKIPNQELVRKVLRSLPKKFAMKVAAIEEAKVIEEIDLN